MLSYLAAAELKILKAFNNSTFLTKGRREVLDIYLAILSKRTLLTFLANGHVYGPKWPLENLKERLLS